MQMANPRSRISEFLCSVCPTTTVLPVTKRAFALSRRKNHLFVVAFDQDNITLLLQLNQSIQYRTAVTSLINQIAKKNQPIR